MLETLIGLIVIGSIGYAVYFVYAIRAGYRRGLHEGRIRGSARRAARGDKPVGEPFYNAAFGSAYFPSTEQLINKGIAFPIDQPVPETFLRLGYSTFNQNKRTRASHLPFLIDRSDTASVPDIAKMAFLPGVGQ